MIRILFIAIATVGTFYYFSNNEEINSCRQVYSEDTCHSILYR